MSAETPPPPPPAIIRPTPEADRLAAAKADLDEALRDPRALERLRRGIVAATRKIGQNGAHGKDAAT